MPQLLQRTNSQISNSSRTPSCDTDRDPEDVIIDILLATDKASVLVFGTSFPLFDDLIISATFLTSWSSWWWQQSCFISFSRLFNQSLLIKKTTSLASMSIFEVKWFCCHTLVSSKQSDQAFLPTKTLVVEQHSLWVFWDNQMKQWVSSVNLIAHFGSVYEGVVDHKGFLAGNTHSWNLKAQILNKVMITFFKMSSQGNWMKICLAVQGSESLKGFSRKYLLLMRRQRFLFTTFSRSLDSDVHPVTSFYSCVNTRFHLRSDKGIEGYNHI